MNSIFLFTALLYLLIVCLRLTVGSIWLAVWVLCSPVVNTGQAQVPKAENRWVRYDELADETQKENSESGSGEIHVNGTSRA